MHRAFGLLIPLFVAATACGGAATPQEVLREYRDALDSADPDRAWDLMSPDVRSSSSEERFEADFERRLQAADVLAEQLDDASRSDAVITATLDYGRFESLEMAYVDGGWQILEGVGIFYSQASPRDALVSFIRAVHHSDIEQILLLVPVEYRAQMDADDVTDWLDRRNAELSETIALLEANVDTPIVESGDSAVLRYGSREIRFLREGGVWVIEDFD